jgi:hypothetical protein
MKSNPDRPGGSLESKPTWSNTCGCSTTSAFFFGSWIQHTTRALEVEQPQHNWVARGTGMPRSASTAGIALLKKCYDRLQNRYGPRYTSAMLSAAFVGFVFPLPGSSLIGVALVVVIAEVHRAFFWRHRSKSINSVSDHFFAIGGSSSGQREAHEDEQGTESDTGDAVPRGLPNVRPRGGDVRKAMPQAARSQGLPHLR